MEWSPQQDAALKDVARWLDDSDQQVYRLFGYAGTGKTTLAKHFAEGIDGSTLFGAFTGKAALVLRQKGCPGATTIHSLIYHARDKSGLVLKELESQYLKLVEDLRQEGMKEPEINSHKQIKKILNLITSERNSLAQPAFSLNLDSEVKYADLVIIDECSMINEGMGEDLLYFGTKVLVLGDPFQLPPVMGGGFFTKDHDPDFMLTEIHRQAIDNPIIHMATEVRENQRLNLGNYGDSRVLSREQVVEEDAASAQQILAGRNKTRIGINHRIRGMKGITDPLPIQGDKLVCLRNNHELGLLNGGIWQVQDVGAIDEDKMFLEVKGDEHTIGVEAHTHYFLGREVDLAWWERKTAEEFDFGYALTVHKAQGSQWDEVLLMNEADCFRKERWRWLYTGITRAANKVTVVQM
jgi:exodeoxyribonuclease-5